MMQRIEFLGLLAVVVAIASPAFSAPLTSGLKPGDTVTPFNSRHLVGPLAGTNNCFPCTFQSRPQVQVWVNGDDNANVMSIAAALGRQMHAHERQELKALIVVLTDSTHEAAAEALVKRAASLLDTRGVDMALLSRTDQAVKDYNINTDVKVKNTVFVYRDWTVSRTFVNLKAAQANALVAAIGRITR